MLLISIQNNCKTWLNISFRMENQFITKKPLLKIVINVLFVLLILLSLGSCKTCKCPAYSYVEYQMPENKGDRIVLPGTCFLF
jgi:hypothetical protein